MIKYLEILEEIFRTSTTSFRFGLRQVDEAIGQMRPGIYGIIGDGDYPMHLALQCLQRNDDLCLYYGYINPPLMAMHRLTAYGMKIPVTQLLVDTRTTLQRNTGFGAFRLRMRFMNFIDMYETLPTPPVSVERMINDIKSVREKDDQLVVICLDDFDAWLRSSLQALDAESADPRRLAGTLRDFCQIYQVIILAACRIDKPSAEVLSEICNATVHVEAQGLSSDARTKKFCLTVRDAISEVPIEYAYSTDLEAFLDRVPA